MLKNTQNQICKDGKKEDNQFVIILKIALQYIILRFNQWLTQYQGMKIKMKENLKRILNKENLSFGLIIKKYILLLGYYRRNYWKNIYFSWSIVLFIISLLMFLSILTPNIVLHRLPMVGEWPRLLELDGSVVVELKDNNYSKFSGIAGVVIEIGGYKSTTDQEGNYHIKFTSETNSNIPVIIQWYNTTIIKKVSFESNQFKKTEVLILNDK